MSDMTVESLAKLLDGREYGSEITREEEAAAKASGLVVVFGASDDLTEWRGAVYEESGSWNGGEYLFDEEGLLPARDEIEEDDELERFFVRRKTAKVVKAIWCATDKASWTYETSIPHQTFNIMEDGEVYCVGLVFDLARLS